MEQIHLTITDEINAYERIERELEQAEYRAENLKVILKDAERRVLDAFEREGATDMTFNGRRWKPEVINTITCIGREGGQELIDWLVANVPGASDKVRATMHHKSRDAMAKETFIDDDGNISIPGELAGYVAPYQDVKLTKRKV